MRVLTRVVEAIETSWSTLQAWVFRHAMSSLLGVKLQEQQTPIHGFDEEMIAQDMEFQSPPTQALAQILVKYKSGHMGEEMKTP